MNAPRYYVIYVFSIICLLSPISILFDTKMTFDQQLWATLLYSCFEIDGIRFFLLDGNVKSVVYFSSVFYIQLYTHLLFSNIIFFWFPQPDPTSERTNVYLQGHWAHSNIKRNYFNLRWIFFVLNFDTRFY